MVKIGKTMWMCRRAIALLDPPYRKLSGPGPKLFGPGPLAQKNCKVAKNSHSERSEESL